MHSVSHLRRSRLSDFCVMVVLFLALFNGRIYANQPSFLYVNLHNNACGMFSVFSYVVGVLHEYDKHSYSGIEVNFEEFGLYFDEEHGSNWWNYYCEPIYFGSKLNSKIRRFTDNEYSWFSLFTEDNLSRSKVHGIIQKYIKIRQHIQNKVDKFVEENFTGHHIIAVHFRGTDKYLEASRVGFNQIRDCINTYVERNQLRDFMIFVASDEQGFVDQMEAAFPDLVLSYDAKRSTDGRALHYGRSPKNNYQKGEEALIDCLLLSRGDCLIRTSSNLSLWSTYFNPLMPVFEMNQRNGK